MIKGLNLRIYGVEGVEIQTKVTEVLLNEIIAEKFQNLRKDVDIKYRRHLEPQIDMIRKETVHITS
jgi:hypothetical protein